LQQDVVESINSVRLEIRLASYLANEFPKNYVIAKGKDLRWNMLCLTWDLLNTDPLLGIHLFKLLEADELW